jgi:hypothetical protein
VVSRSAPPEARSSGVASRLDASSSSGWWWLAGAAVFHAVIPLLALIAPAGRVTLTPITEPLRIIDIEIPATVAGHRAPETLTERSPREAITEARRAPRREPNERPSDPRDGAREEAVEPPVEPSPVSPEGPPQTSPSTAPPSEYDSPPPERNDIIFAPGVGGKPVWALPGALPDQPTPAPAPTVPGRPRETDRDIAGTVLRKVQTENDKAKGIDLPAAGTVASAIKAAVQGSDAPNEGRATFEVRLGPRGQVLGVRVISSSSGGNAGWSTAAASAQARLAGRTLAMSGDFAKGATVYIDVVSKMALPAGSAGGIKPGAAGAVGGSIDFDAANIGARAKRSVSSSYRVVPNR